MTGIPLKLPKGSVVKGALRPQYDIEDLDQGILEVALPNGLTIDVGWYPPYDRAGSFRVVVYRDYWPDQVQEPLFAKTTTEVARAVERLAKTHSKTPPASTGAQRRKSKAKRT